MSLLDRYKIEDKNTREVIKQLESEVAKGVDGNMKVHKKELRRSDVAGLNEEVLHFDSKNKKLIMRFGKDLYEVQLTKVT